MYHNGSPIRRDKLVRLFSTILRKEPDGRITLVTPVESVGITVEDAPFLAVEMAVEGRAKAGASPSAPTWTIWFGRCRARPALEQDSEVGSSPTCMCGATCGHW